MFIKVLFSLAAILAFCGAYHMMWKQRKVMGPPTYSLLGFMPTVEIQEYRNTTLAFIFFGLALISAIIGCCLLF